MALAATIWADPSDRFYTIVGGITAVIIGVLYAVGKIRTAAKDVGLIKEQVKNDHTTNLREEADERHDQNYRTLARIEQKLDDVSVKVGVHAYRLDEIDEELGRTRDRRPERP